MSGSYCEFVILMGDGVELRENGKAVIVFDFHLRTLRILDIPHSIIRSMCCVGSSHHYHHIKVLQKDVARVKNQIYNEKLARRDAPNL